jgi:multidrug efflux pump subunit AcrB
VRIELNPDKLNAHGITAASVNQQLRGTNVDLGSGRGQVAGSEQAIRVLGDARNVAELANTTIALPNGRFVKVSDLGVIKDTYQEPKSFSRFNSAPVVTFGVFRAKGASEVTVAKTVGDTLNKVRAENPNVSIEMIDDSVYYTYGNYEAAMHTLLEGALLAVLVVFLFLRNWRATLISAVALPLSAMPSSRSRTSPATSRWARRLTVPPSMPPMKSAWPSSRRPSPSSRSSSRSPSCRAFRASTSFSSA